LAGVFIAKKKPPLAFLKPFCKQMQDLEEKGVIIQSLDRDPYVCKVRLLFGIVDTPARAYVTNMKSFNSRHTSGGGCLHCWHPGKELVCLMKAKAKSSLRTKPLFTITKRLVLQHFGLERRLRE
jgi:hypothetical protein